MLKNDETKTNYRVSTSNRDYRISINFTLHLQGKSIFSRKNTDLKKKNWFNLKISIRVVSVWCGNPVVEHDDTRWTKTNDTSVLVLQNLQVLDLQNLSKQFAISLVLMSWSLSKSSRIGYLGGYGIDENDAQLLTMPMADQSTGILPKIWVKIPFYLSCMPVFINTGRTP